MFYFVYLHNVIFFIHVSKIRSKTPYAIVCNLDECYSVISLTLTRDMYKCNIPAIQ
jgi:hypothetical protein